MIAVILRSCLFNLSMTGGTIKYNRMCNKARIIERFLTIAWCDDLMQLISEITFNSVWMKKSFEGFEQWMFNFNYLAVFLHIYPDLNLNFYLKLYQKTDTKTAVSSYLFQYSFICINLTLVLKFIIEKFNKKIWNP